MTLPSKLSVVAPAILGVTFGTVIMPQVLPAADLFVCQSGCMHSTIQGAVDAAASGDAIHIARGRYVGNVTIIGKALKLIGGGGTAASVTEVYGIGYGPVFTLGSGVDDAYELVEIYDLTIAHGDHESGTGIGGGIQVRRGAYLHVFNSIVTGNTAWFGGGIGVDTPGGPKTTISGCLIDDNQVVAESLATGDGGSGGGVDVVGASTVAIQQSTIARNHALEGGGIFTDLGSHVTVEHSTLTDNGVVQVHAHRAFVGGVGGGLGVNAAIAISDSVIANNAATGPESPRGGGLFIVVNGTQTIADTVVTHNSADGGAGSGGDGGGIFAAAAEKTATLGLDRVYVIENSASQGDAGGISNEGTLVLTHTTIKDNSGLNCAGGIGCPP
jgi:hypothetical protein